MIELLHISKRFGGVQALSDVSLSLAPGERVALVGENGAGKTSLMNVLYGLYQPDAGSLRFEGREARLATPKDALARGVGMVHQHFTLVPTLTVAENVVLGAEPTRAGLLFDAERAEREVQATARRFGFTLDARALVGTLTVGSQQKVEIVKALHRGVKTLILDEPTAVLTPQEADELFQVTRTLSEAGLTVVLISHKLKEVLSFATRVAVMRKGALVKEARAQETNAAELAKWMVGEGAESPFTLSPSKGAERPPAEPPFTLSPSKGAEQRPTALETRGLAALPRLVDVSLAVRAGEILGIAGVDGNGQRELAEVLTGLRRATSGTFTVLGEAATTLTPKALRARGLTHIPEDRLRHAIVPALTVEENVSFGRQASAPFAKGPWVDFAGRRARTTALLEAHDVRPRAPLVRMGGLSGGNQQKLVVGRELDGAPKVLVAVQPTRGLDIAAVAAVRRHLVDAKARGCAILLISLDLDEVLELSDRVVTMFEGRLTGEFTRGEYDERVLGRRMLGVKDA